VKTAISIDDRLLQEADETARLMGLSRSRLFALALVITCNDSVRNRCCTGSTKFYASAAEPAEKRLLKGIKAKVRRTVKERW